MNNSEVHTKEGGADGKVDIERREVLGAIAKYASVAGASTVVLSASASVSLASVSGHGGGKGKSPKRRRRRRRRMRRWLRSRH